MANNNKPLFLFVGKSGSGKTTIANMLEKDGYTQVKSYTTRPKRYYDENNHTFISYFEYTKLNNVIANVCYNGYHYCATLDQVNDADIYVIDPDGVNELILNNYKVDRDIIIVYFKASPYKRISRMKKRGDSVRTILRRILNDDVNSSFDYFEHVGMYWYDSTATLPYIVNANTNTYSVYQNVKRVIETSYK